MENIRMVTKIEELSKTRYKIDIDNEFAFVLYRGELSAYGIKIDQPIEEKNYQTIITELLPKRAKKRSLNLLKTRPYTEKKLRDKLKESLYSQEVIEEAMDYVKSFHYIDDYDFACQYIEYYKSSKSRRKMEEALAIKGISKEILHQAFIDSYENEEEQYELELFQARRLLEKKEYNPETVDWKEKQKLYGFLIRKGISTGVIRKVLDVTEYD